MPHVTRGFRLRKCYGGPPTPWRRLVSRASPRLAVATLLVAVVTTNCSTRPRIAADLLITHAKIWTGNPSQPSADALAIIGDRIVDVGSASEVEQWRGANTTVLDAAGRRVMPGFNDAHVQLVSGGVELDNVDLKDAGSQAEFVRRIAERVKARRGEWILGGFWDERTWAPSALPTRRLIDDATNGTPVFVTRFDGRMALANSAALGRAGITEHTIDPPGGSIVRDPATGFPTGVLTDAAMTLVARAVPIMASAQRLHVIKRALEHAASLGVTSVQDLDPASEDLSAFADLAARGELTVRIYAALPDTGWYDQAKLGVHRAFGSSWLRIGAVTAIADAVTPPAPREIEATRIRLMAADHAGLQLWFQAAGDAGISLALDFAGDIARTNGGRDRRLRVEHAGAFADREVARLASVGAIASVQPSSGDAGKAFRPLLDKGVRLALGTGWPKAPLNPLLAIHAAVTTQRMTIGEAVSAYTSGSAFAEFQDVEKGTLARGKLADVVILSGDIFGMPVDRINTLQVLTTIVGGRIVHQRNP